MSEAGAGALRRGLTLRTAAALVVANIIGAGIFTTTGFQAAELGHPGYIFALWVLGGVLAFCGAVCYGELAAMMPQAGGEYVYLRDTYGRVFGFMSAFVSLIAGFSAPIAAALKSFVRYLGHFFPMLAEPPALFLGTTVNDLLAVALVWLLVAVHFRGMQGGFAFNDIITLLKIVGIVGIILAAAAVGRGDAGNFSDIAPVFYETTGAGRIAAFATSLIFVMFCYSGWNAAAYVAEEMRDPQRDLPRALLLGTAIVTVLYLGLNAVYFYGASASELAGRVEVGLVASRQLFGPTGVTLVTLVLCVSIFASASAMTIAGPRVYFAFGRDFAPLRILAGTNEATGAPRAALLLQGVVTSVIIVSGSVAAIESYAGFTLGLFATLAVSCVLVLRRRHPEWPRPYRAWGYPFTPFLFMGVMTWTMFWAIHGRPLESLLGLATAAVGGLLFYLAPQVRRR